MAQKNWNDDYIPTAADIAAKREDCKSRREAYGVTIPTYKVTYEVHGVKRAESIAAMTEDEAIAVVKQQWGMVGMIPLHLVAERVITSAKC